MTETIAAFSDYAFRDSVFEAIRAAEYEVPTPIQAACIPEIMAGKDVIGLAQTGTGKTAAFALPIIERLAQSVDMGALVIAPTRELAQQTAEVFEQLGRSSGIRVATVVGGIPIKQDHEILRSWPNVLVATPGRLLDHIYSSSVMLDDVQILVIDEADRMHDMGFIPQIRSILEALPKSRQTLMFSATMPPDVERIARRQMSDPVRIQVGRRSAPAERAEQRLYQVHESDKVDLLLDLLREQDTGRVLIFVRTKVAVDRLARRVAARHHGVTRLHSNRDQLARNEAMSGFREGRYRILIATDIAARGLDVANIEHVINYDFPFAAEDYVHRIGRTARVAASGLATSFVTRDDQRCLSQLERLLGTQLTLTPAPRSRSNGGQSGSRERSNSRGRSSSRSRSRRARPAAAAPDKAPPRADA